MKQVTEKTHRVLRVIGEVWRKRTLWDLGRPKTRRDMGGGEVKRGTDLGGGLEGSSDEV